MVGPSVPEILLFDVMGTVVDIAGSIRRDAVATLAPLGSDDHEIARVIADSAAELQRSMTEIVDGDAPWRGHRTLREAALREVAPELPDEVVSRLASVVARLDPWPDSPAALDRLRASCRVVALSNADTAELVALSAHGGLGRHGVLSAQAARSYKPDPAVYLMAAEQLDAAPAAIMMVAAHPWDLRAAAAVGFATAYVRRPDADPPADTDAFTLDLADLTELAGRLT